MRNEHHYRMKAALITAMSILICLLIQTDLILAAGLVVTETEVITDGDKSQTEPIPDTDKKEGQDSNAAQDLPTGYPEKEQNGTSANDKPSGGSGNRQDSDGKTDTPVIADHNEESMNPEAADKNDAENIKNTLDIKETEAMAGELEAENAVEKPEENTTEEDMKVSAGIPTKSGGVRRSQSDRNVKTKNNAGIILLVLMASVIGAEIVSNRKERKKW